MTTGIIYQAFNKISKKSYIGQTTCTLEKRISGHYTTAKKFRYKFCNALNKYNKEDWEWLVICEVNKEYLNAYEQKYISEFNSYKNGYNSTLGGDWSTVGHPNHIEKIINLYHIDHGELFISRNNIKLIDHQLHINLNKLLSGKVNHLSGYVLLENKDKYKEILNIHEFYHPSYEVVEGIPYQLSKKYGLNINAFTLLVREEIKQHKGWVLSKHKDMYNTLVINRIKAHTFYHEMHGEIKCTVTELCNKYNLNNKSIHGVASGRYKKIKGWSIHLQSF